MNRRANSMAIMGEAADTIGDNVSEEPVEGDWAARFFIGAEDVSTPQLQKLWGKLLAREVEKPGAVPLRTLEILRNMTRSEASLLQSFTTYMLSDPAYFYQPGVGLTDIELRILQESGVLEPDQAHLVWQDYMQPTEPPAGSSVTNLAIGRSRARVRFPTGHILEIVTFGPHPDFPIARVTPAATPLVRMTYETTDREYLRELSLKLPTGLEPRVEARVLAPEPSQIEAARNG